MSRNQTSQVKSTVLELLAITGLAAVKMGSLLPAVQRGDRVNTNKSSVREARQPSLVSHLRAIPRPSTKL